ncbi:thiamine pyrophosphate-binding protein [Haloarchaeobius sp. HME9146]|uniref:thiamine pyrophosphate-binding protein n=1 Tax=Haloarchaeobius sp. HME9146 TaxID=2978732 RepID=UPI0021C181B2|nr:thiamine pyrophosphate-binding protein [Haloarchaeobius sp. HME9146]MCT9097270.1 thiamine pyrophosphate-binding protein [Haloarchaeobius sp. HME9146]
MTESRTGAELFVDALDEYGVEYVFGNPGTTELPVVNAIADSELEYILGLHEDVAVGAAAGYASVRRQFADEDEGVPAGVVNLHVAPGMAHGLGNLYGAYMAGAPLVVTAGNHERHFRHEEPILSGDLVKMTEQFTKWSDEVLSVDTLPSMLRQAFRVACTPPTGPVFLALPLDVMTAETDAAPEPLGTIPNPGRGDPAAIEQAADALAEADNPVLVVGDHVGRHQAWSGVDPVEAAVDLAEAAGARVHGEILGYEVNFPTDHEQWVSHVPPDEQLAQTLFHTDTLVFAGCSTNTTLWAHDNPLVPEDATIVDLTDQPWQGAKNHPATVVTGDMGHVMAELAAAVRDRVDDETREERLVQVDAMKQLASQQMNAMGEDETAEDAISKADLVDAMKSVDPDAFVMDEGVTSRYALLTRWDFQRGQIMGNKGGGLGYGLPAAVGAALAERDSDDPRTVYGFVGDGSYLYYPNSLYTAARYDLDLTVVVPDNRNYRILKDNTVSMFGGEESDYEFVGMDFDPPVDIPKNAESHGASGYLVESVSELDDTLAEAAAESGPSVVDVLIED